MLNNNKGFSLIELSIVLIILGLLVAGVTGGASLIKSAKIRSVCNDFLNYKNAYNAYYTEFGERAGTENGVFNAGKTFEQLVDKGVVDGTNLDGNVMTTTKIKYDDASFYFVEDSGLLTNNAQLFGGDIVLLVLGLTTSEEGKAILQKIDTKEGNTGNVRAVYDGAVSVNLDEDKTGSAYNLYMKMDF